MNGSLGLLDAALCVVEQGIFPDLFQRLLAQDMLCLAGILGGDVLVPAQLHKEMGQQAVAAIDALCDLAARLKKGQVCLLYTSRCV